MRALFGLCYFTFEGLELFKLKLYFSHNGSNRLGISISSLHSLFFLLLFIVINLSSTVFLPNSSSDSMGEKIMEGVGLFYKIYCTSQILMYSFIPVMGTLVTVKMTLSLLPILKQHMKVEFINNYDRHMAKECQFYHNKN